MRFAFKPPAAPKLLPLIAAALWLCGGGALAEAPLLGRSTIGSLSMHASMALS